MERVMDNGTMQALAKVAPMGRDTSLKVEFPGLEKVPKEFRSFGVFRPFSAAAREKLAEFFAQNQKSSFPVELVRQVVKDEGNAGWIDWGNVFERMSLLAKKPKEIPFSKDLIDELDPEIVYWAFSKIQEITWITDQEGLESSPPSKPKGSRKAARPAGVPRA